jgi:hypothetical protein
MKMPDTITAGMSTALSVVQIAMTSTTTANAARFRYMVRAMPSRPCSISALLTAEGVLEGTSGSHGHTEYVLTGKGITLWPVVRSLLAWGDEHCDPRHEAGPGSQVASGSGCMGRKRIRDARASLNWFLGGGRCWVRTNVG